MNVARTISAILQADALERAGWSDADVAAFLADLDRIDREADQLPGVS